MRDTNTNVGNFSKTQVQMMGHLLRKGQLQNILHFLLSIQENIEIGGRGGEICSEVSENINNHLREWSGRGDTVIRCSSSDYCTSTVPITSKKWSRAPHTAYELETVSRTRMQGAAERAKAQVADRRSRTPQFWPRYLQVEKVYTQLLSAGGAGRGWGTPALLEGEGLEYGKNDLGQHTR